MARPMASTVAMRPASSRIGQAGDEQITGGTQGSKSYDGDGAVDGLARFPADILARFQSLEKDVVTEELRSLGQPLDLGKIESLIDEYSALEEGLGTCLGGRLISNYEGFMRGMQHVQQVDLEFAYIRVKIKNSRRRLETADQALGQGGLYVARRNRRRERIEAVLEFSAELRGLLDEYEKMKECAQEEKFHDAVKMNARLLHVMRSSRFRGEGESLFGWLRNDLRHHLEELKQKLRERSMRAAARAEVEFDADAYEEVLDALVRSGIEELTATAADTPSAASGRGLLI